MYKDDLAEALAEFKQWDLRPELRVRIGNTVFIRTRRPPCECGNRHFAKGKCKTCYYREYNAKRPGSRSGVASAEVRRAIRRRYQERHRDEINAKRRKNPRVRQKSAASSEPRWPRNVRMFSITPCGKPHASKGLCAQCRKHRDLRCAITGLPPIARTQPRDFRRDGTVQEG